MIECVDVSVSDSNSWSAQEWLRLSGTYSIHTGTQAQIKTSYCGVFLVNLYFSMAAEGHIDKMILSRIISQITLRKRSGLRSVEVQ